MEDKPKVDEEGYYLPGALTDTMVAIYLARVYDSGLILDPGLLGDGRRGYKRIYDHRHLPAAKAELDKLTSLFIALRLRKAAS